MRSVWRIGLPQRIQNDPPRTPKGRPRDTQGDPWTHIAASEDAPECAKTSLCIASGELWPLLGSLSCAELPYASREQQIIQKVTQEQRKTEHAETSVCVAYGALGPDKDSPRTPQEPPRSRPRRSQEQPGTPKVSPRIPKQPQGRPEDRPGRHRDPTSTPKYPQ